MASDARPPVCALCNTPAEDGKKLLTCTRCKSVQYHSRECQKKHYPQHKKICRQMGASYVGVEVVDSRTNLGRVVVAKQAFSAGDTVLTEAPAIVFGRDGYIDLFTKYLDAPKQIQESILDMYQNTMEDHKLLNMDHLIEQEMQQLEHKAKHLLTMDIARKLVNIVNLNAHGFLTTGETQVPVNGGVSSTVLYVLGSKIEHSCVPNAYTHITSSGFLHCRAQTPINRGERITASYMSGEYKHPRSDRRGYLKANKKFTCNCKRCLGFDECNPFKCPSCRKHTMFEGGGSGRYLESNYYCMSCNNDVQSTDRMIKSQIIKCSNFESRVAEAQAMLRMGGLETAGTMCLDLYEDISTYHASQLHWLYPTVWKLTGDTFASLARMYMQQGMPAYHPTVGECIRMSGYVQLLEVKWIQQAIAVMHGWTNIKDAAMKSNCCPTIELKPTPPVSAVKSLIGELTTDMQTFWYPSSAVTLKIYHAGRDMLLVSLLREDVAKLYEKYWDSLKTLKDLDEGELTWMAALIKSKGDDNRFPNHLLC